jgi:GNAT superfamily N-acetyltransferase
MLSIRKAVVADVPLILEFVRWLAEYERAPNAVRATEDDLRRYGFGPAALFRSLIAEWDGRPAGIALFFFNFSTWHGKPALYLEDLFVMPEMRGHGIGKALLQKLAQIAIEENCYAVAWMVLKWNDPAIKFYESLGATTLGEWDTMRIMGPALSKLAGQNPSASKDETAEHSAGVPQK